LRTSLLVGALVAGLAVLAAGCGSSSQSSGATATSARSCEPRDLNLVKTGRLTIGTDNPAFPPWFGGGTSEGSKWKINDPATGKGFESAVAYAVARKMGFKRNEVDWVVVPFEQAFKPGSKNFDFAINQISFTPARAKSVDFSSSYYDVNQALVGIKGTPITSVKTRADLKDYKLGAQIGTTSYDYITKNIKPKQQPSVYNTSNDVNSALKAKQIDGIVVDLPTAFFIVGAEQVPNSVVVGQFPSVGGPEHFGMVFQKGNTLVKCVDEALASLKADGTLARIQNEWLSSKVSAPVLK
jgi:polar amino acid transport system substrate-binding protein